MKILVIDDNAEILSSLKSIFADKIDIAECHNAVEAIKAINNQKPDVVLVDHHLTENGNEGLEIVDGIRGVKFYSTSSDSRFAAEYEKRGVEVIGKNNVRKIKEMIDAK